MKFYEIDINYMLFLRQYDERIMDVLNNKEKRPHLGIVLNINELDYVVPLTSPKPKHLIMKNKIDFIKIKEGKLGAINLNNMFPIRKEFYKELNISLEKDEKYKLLLENQISWCNEKKNEYIIYKNANKLYFEIINKQEKSFLWERCCNFKLLEEKSHEYFLK